MPRRKEFDPEKALGAALEIFWDRGYEKTSLDDLMRATGVGRQSLYDTFGDKRALYLRALDAYRTLTQADLRRHLASGRPIRDRLADLLLGIARESRRKHERGCLLLSANLEREADDEAISALVKRNQAEVEAIFEDALRRAQQAGELSPARRPRALARFVVATIQGMRSTARAKSNRTALEEVARVALAALG